MMTRPRCQRDVCRRASLAALVALLAPMAALAQRSVTFDGERYVLRHENRRGDIPVVEYVRPGESLDAWTRLVAIRHFPKLTDPRAAAANLARVVREHNPSARAEVIVNDAGSEAIVDFITWARGDERLEFNVHRYRKVEGMPGLIAYQFAWRFRTADLGDATKTVSTNRRRWIAEMTRLDPGNPFARDAAR